MKKIFMVLSFGISTTLVAGCCSFGGSNVKLDTGKIEALRKVALVGVCLQKDVSTIAGTQNTGTIRDGGKLLLGPLTESLNAALPTLWTGVEVVPLGPGIEAAGRTVGETRVCANDHDPMQAGGFVGAPDKAYLGTLATRLNVDAVLVISGYPVVRFWDGKGAKLYVASVGDGFQTTLVNRLGEETASIQLRDFETAYSPEIASANNFVDVKPMGESLGKLVAEGFVANVQSREWNPPSRPGLSGL